MRTTQLGNSALVESEETFLTVNVDSEKKSLQQQGAVNGKANSPSSDARNPDDVENGIITKIVQTVQQTQSGLEKHFSGFAGCLTPIVKLLDQTALMNQIEAMPVNAKNALDNMLNKFKVRAAIEGPKWKQAQDENARFRKNNNLIRPADYSSMWSNILWFGGLILVEAVLNASLLWELTGFLLAFGQTVLITVVNVVILAASMGLLMRYKNHASRVARWRTWVCVPVVALVVIFNVGVGHYRDALSEAKAQAEQLLTSSDWDSDNNEYLDLGFIDYAQKAMDNIRDSFFGIDSILSALLIIIGIGFFGIATFKWYSALDVYPGYKKCDMALKKAHKNYEIFVNATRNKMQEKIDDALDRVADESVKITNIQTQRTELIGRAKALNKSYESWCVVLNQAQTTLLEVYRSSNRKSRSDAAPEYFDETIPIDSTLTNLPNFDPPEWEVMDDVVQAIKLADKEINKISAEIWSKFNKLENMQQQTDESG